MRNHILFGLRTLLTAARVTLYTRQAPAAKSKFNLEPFRVPVGPDRTIGFDDWMFEAGASVERQTEALANEMTALDDSLSGLRETLALISGAAPFPLDATTQRPCAIMHHDRDLFDGEAMPLPPAQDNTVGGEGVFLFDDEPAFGEISEQHAA